MAETSAIEWTDSTWNPVTGCTKVSRGCDNCYAERFAERFRGVAGHPFEVGFDLTLREERPGQPLRWRRSRQIFVNSKSDLFHKEVPWSFVDRVFDVIEKAGWHVYQIVTKLSSLMRDYLRLRYAESVVPSHIWCGVSVEDRSALVNSGGISPANSLCERSSHSKFANWPIQGGIAPINSLPRNVSDSNLLNLLSWVGITPTKSLPGSVK